jgi:MYXO-CTERM domain-containing protein
MSPLRAVLLLAALAACAEQPAETGEVSQPIIGGFDTTLYPSVGMIQSTSGLCSGTLVTPTVILTAAHCIYPSIQANETSIGTVSFGASQATFFAEIDILDMWAHRYYEDSIAVGYDIGLIRLAEEAPEEVPVMPFSQEPIDETWLGTEVTVVGFGVTDGESQTGSGTKRQISLTIDEVVEDEIGLGVPGRNICQGDSGGPTFIDMGGTDTVLAVSSYGSNFCMNRSYCTRTDVHVDSGLKEVIAAWTGPCAQDGECVTEGCGEFPDPDCDGCGYDGFCMPECPKLDLDCPIVGFAGAFCEVGDDCESRLCVQALDDTSVSYCSTSCETTEDCELPLGVCQDGQCYFSGMTPGTQGADCSNGDDCNSGVCHPDHDICVNQCGDGYPECSEPYVCGEVGGASACVPEEEGGCGCRAGSEGGGLPGLLGLVFLIAVLYRRSKTR